MNQIKCSLIRKLKDNIDVEEIKEAPCTNKTSKK